MPFFENNKDNPKKSKVKAIQFLLQKIQVFVTNASTNKRVTSWTPALFDSVSVLSYGTIFRATPMVLRFHPKEHHIYSPL